MIRSYSFGTPYGTDAVTLELPPESGSVPFFQVEPGEGGSGTPLRFSIRLAPEDLLFGLGETLRGLNKRGHRYVSWNSDVTLHAEDRESLYGAHNLLMFFGPEKRFAVYLDDPGRVVWDLGETRTDLVTVTSENGDLDLYLLEGDSLRDIAREFRRLTGRSYLPPRWAFGYIQSRWGYAAEEQVREVVREHRDRHIPLDSLCLDIDYMDAFKNFTWRTDSFPDLKTFAGAMRAEGIHLVPIIDAGIRKEPGYAPYDEGKEADVFCRKEDGSEFVAAVWPGMCCFTDYLREDARAWFGSLYRPLVEAGVEGFWNDMNEPSLFYTEDGLRRANEAAAEQLSHPENFEGMWGLHAAFQNLANSAEDLRSFYHRLDDGRTVRHDRVHNLYGAGMTRATADGLRRLLPDRRYLLFSRASFIGAHRNGGIWMGDNTSWWGHIRLALSMLPALNLCGFLYCGCDLGGFGGNTTEDLMERFLQLGVFLPLMRNHSALHTRDQEIYRFSIWETMRDTLSVRYALIPYLYSEFMKAALSDGMLFRPLAFDYPEDLRAVRVEDQLMLGGECMIAPVTEPNAWGRYVYLPEDMLLIRFRSAADFDFEHLEAGDHYIDLNLGEFPLFVRKGRFVPLCPGGETVDSLDFTSFRTLGWDAEGASYALYRDDGLTPAPALAENLTEIPFVE